MTKEQRVSKGARYSTDDLARNLWLNLVDDFRLSEGDSFCRKAESAFNSSIADFREYEFPELGYQTKARFKRWKQVENLLKKYRFATDAFSDEDLYKNTFEKYFEEQVRILTPVEQSLTTKMVLQQARSIVKSILGEYVPEDVITGCKFGKKSSIGCPLRLAHIDIKLSNAKAFTGSSLCTQWFRDSIISDDQILNQIVTDLAPKWDSEQLRHESLNLVVVPKTWKTYRVITPLTLLSLFYSNGVGNVIAGKLKEARLDIGKLQDQHRKRVELYSISRRNATADLSAASDSISIELLQALLPRAWFVACKPLFTHQIIWKDENGVVKEGYTASVLPMGNGLTFPMETLIFYSLIKAIGNLVGVRGLYSVYGDDLIYPSKIHKYVVKVFPQLKLKLNLDKTFVRYPFRESCGADFYRGCDVRSFYLQGSHQNLTRFHYASLLHKTINGLRMRWNDLEMPGTLAYLFNELSSVTRQILRVPPQYPDFAGIKVQSPDEKPSTLPGLCYEPVICQTDNNGNHKYTFKALTVSTDTRIVVSQMPYYWLALQGLDDKPVEYNRFVSRQPPSKEQLLYWKKFVKIRFYKRKDGTRVRKKLVKVLPTVASRLGMKLSTSVGLIHEWV